MKPIILLLFIFCLSQSCSNTTENKAEKQIKNIDNQEYQNLKADAVYERGLNIYALLSNDSTIQLTFNKSDSLPFIIPRKDYVVFVRTNKVSGYETKALMLVNIFNLKESIITDEKPYVDGQDISNSILEIRQPSLSLDGKSILFITEKYATGSQLVMVNISSGKWTELFTAEWYQEIKKKPYEGHFLVGQSIIGDNGRGIYYRLVDSTGQVVKKFDSKESMAAFEKTLK